jgi:ubiquinone biosynthesis protein
MMVVDFILFLKYFVLCLAINIFKIDNWKLIIFGWNNISVSSKKSVAKNINNTLIKCGPFFQKIGQLLSAYDRYLPVEITQELKSLQDKNWVNLLDSEEVNRVLSNSPYVSLIKNIESVPIASGTVAQVHSGYLIDSTKVAIKIRKPLIRDLFERDLRVIKIMAKLINWYFGSNSNKLAKLVEYMGYYVIQQTDLGFEHCNITEFRKNNQYVIDTLKTVELPHVIGEPYEDVLVMKYIEAESCGEYDWSKLSQEHRNYIATELSKFVVDNAINHACYHIDLHPGNIMYDRSTNKIYLIDFGLIGKCDQQVVRYKSALVALLSEYNIDYDKLIKHDVEFQYENTKDIFNDSQLMEEYRIFLKETMVEGEMDFIKYSNERMKLEKKFGMMSKDMNSSLYSFDIAMLCLNSTINVICPDFKLSSLTG